MFDDLDFDDREVVAQVLAEALGLMTERQVEVLRLCCSGMTQAEAGKRLGIGQRTTSHHFKAAIRKVKKIAKKYV